MDAADIAVRRFVAKIVAAQVLVQIGAFSLPALLPGYIARWHLTKTEAGWAIGVFFAAYVVAVPVLVSLTDRLPARRIYLIGAGATAISHLGFVWIADGFWSAFLLRAIAGIGWAGCYMPGLKAIADKLEGTGQSRAVSWHAAGVGVAGASSFIVAGLWERFLGPESAFLFGGLAALVAMAIAALTMDGHRPKRGAGGAVLDFRPVFRNRAAMAWIAGYTVHTWELAVLRAWGVTFLTATATRVGAPTWMPDSTALFTAAGFVGIVVSITGNETAQKRGRAKVVLWAMTAATIFSVLAGWSTAISLPLATALVLVWNAAIYLDSSALTAGTVQAAEKEYRGATMGLHSMAGYAGGFVGPLATGIALDWFGDTPLGWGIGFGHVAVTTLAGLWVLRRLGR